VPYSQRYLFTTIPDTNHNANPTNPNHYSKGNPNLTNPTNPNTRYCCEYGTLNSMFALVSIALYTCWHRHVLSDVKAIHRKKEKAQNSPNCKTGHDT